MVLEEKDQTVKTPIEQLSVMVDTVPVQVWSLSDIETYGKVNQCHADFLGKPKADIEFRKLRDLFSTEVADACLQSNRQVFGGMGPITTEQWAPDANGNLRLLRITKTPRYDPTGKIDHIACVAIDITEQKQLEAELTQSEQNFRSFIESIDDIVVVGNPDGQILYVNPAASRVLGFSRGELSGKPIVELHPESQREEAARILAEMLRGQGNVCPLPLQSKTGRLIPVETRVTYGSWNGADCIFGLSKDLSREQDALQKFDRFFRMNPSPMAVSALPGRALVDVNDAFVAFVGYTREEALGKTSQELGLFVGDGFERATEALAESGRIREMELRARSKRGDIIDGLFSGEIIESQGRRYFLSVMVDLTTRKRAEAELRKTIEELRNALSEIKVLRGIVPICASCKNIRDDRGYWEQLEAYFARHTDLRFSHSLCPECMKGLYPGFLRDDPDQ